jgi:hypothetical protein
MFYSRDELSDVRLLELLRAATFDANALIDQTHAVVAETHRLLELIAKIECPCIGQSNSTRNDLLPPTDEVIE